jgi:hypothetical protein
LAVDEGDGQRRQLLGLHFGGDDAPQFGSYGFVSGRRCDGCRFLALRDGNANYSRQGK